MLARFVREQRRMNAAEDDEGPSGPRGLSDPVAAQRIPRVDADADHVAGLD